MKPAKEACDRAIAALISSTKVKRRSLSLCQIASELQTAINCFGSIEFVAEQIGLSPSMLKRFQYVLKLEPDLKSLVNARKIDSIDAVAELSSLAPEHQQTIACLLSNETFQTEEIRNIVRLLNNHRELSLKQVVDKIRSGKTQRLFVYEFVIRESMNKPGYVEANILKILKPDELASVELKGIMGRLKVFKSGRQRISAQAKARRLSVTNFVQRLCEGLEK